MIFVFFLLYVYRFFFLDFFPADALPLLEPFPPLLDFFGALGSVPGANTTPKIKHDKKPKISIKYVYLITFSTLIWFFHYSIKISTKAVRTIPCTTKFTHIRL
jgi:hypothetical protein